PSGRSYLVWLGVAWLGAIAVPLNTEYRGASLIHALNNSGAKALVTTKAMMERVVAVTDQLTALETVVLSDGDEHPWSKRVVGLDELLVNAKPVERDAPKEYDPYGVIFTSG